METINGYVVICSRPSGHKEERVILAVREDGDSAIEYVTAYAKDDGQPVTSWFWGNYFWGPRSEQQERLTEAVEDFKTRGA